MDILVSRSNINKEGMVIVVRKFGLFGILSHKNKSEMRSELDFRWS